MSWASALRKAPALVEAAKPEPLQTVPVEKIDWPRLVTLDFETFYSSDYTLKKLSVSEFVRDPRFKAQMVGIKIGRRATKLYTAKTLKAALKAIDWSTHSLLCHNTMFDGFILSHHYGIKPKRYYDTLSMARGLHSNEIGAGLDEVAKFYGGEGKIEGVLDATKGVEVWTPNMVKHVGPYCARDVNECFRVFTEMAKVFPAKEMSLVHMTIRMFCAPVLKVDIPRVKAEYKREVDRREALLLTTIDPAEYEDQKLLKKAEHELPEKERCMLIAKRVIGSNEKFANLLREQGVEPPRKISPAWIKNGRPDDGTKWAYAFAKDDLEFVDLPTRVWDEVEGLDRDNPDDVAKVAAISDRLQQLVNARIATKSTTNITRAQRFITAGSNGAPLPVGYRYFGAATGRWAGANSMNMQNLTRGGELRLSILAAPKHSLCVVDSGQIEARVNAWLWDQLDLLEAFRAADTGTGRDAYCRFADNVYGREITKKDPDERFLGKVCVLGLGYQMGPNKFQMTLAKGALGGPRINFSLLKCTEIVNTYRRLNYGIVNGWELCKRIISDMASGRVGSHKCISWGFEHIVLPNGMTLKYPDLRQAKNENGWDEWTYAAKDVRKKIYGGLLCLGADTEVLTDAGWKPVTSVTSTDRLWDGNEWVNHDGLVHNGTKETIDFGGVRMTPDHQVLIGDKWFEAQETTHGEATSSFDRHYWTPARFNDGYIAEQKRWAARVLADQGLHASELHVGDVHTASKQPTRTEAVYDLVNAGPNRRFTIRGADHKPFLAHNCENLVQALARIIVGEQMLMIDQKYSIVMTTHDEAVAHVRTTQADKCFALMTEAFRTPLAWCPDLPLNSEGGHATNYSK